jgi:hypothetical protein
MEHHVHPSRNWSLRRLGDSGVSTAAGGVFARRRVGVSQQTLGQKTDALLSSGAVAEHGGCPPCEHPAVSVHEALGAGAA